MLGVVIYILLLGIVLMFTIPNEIKNMYERDGRESPVSAIWGLWFLLPIIGQHHLVRQGAAVAQRLLAEQGRASPAEPCARPSAGVGMMWCHRAIGR